MQMVGVERGTMKDVWQIPGAEIREVTTHKKAHLSLLLIGDEEEAMIDRYLTRGTLYVLFLEKKAAAVCVVAEEADALEVKNLAVAPERQRQGIGRALLRWVCGRYRNRCGTIRLGTGDASSARAFYRACGFVECGRIPDFFTKNYSRPLYEEGRLLRDMILYERKTAAPWE